MSASLITPSTEFNDNMKFISEILNSSNNSEELYQSYQSSPTKTSTPEISSIHIESNLSLLLPGGVS